MKKLGIVVAILLIAVAGGIYYLSSNLNDIVRRLIERVGTETVGTAVNVGSVELDLGEGRGTIRKLSVANPEGFSSASALSLGEITVAFDTGSLRGSPIVVNVVDVAEPVVRFEVNGSAQANLNELKTGIEANTASSAAAAKEKEEAGEQTPATKIRVRRFSFAEGRIEADTTAAGGKEEQLVLPSIQLTDIGGEEGTSPGRVASAIASALVAEAGKTAARSELQGYLDKKVRDELGGTPTERASEEAEKMIEGVSENIKGLFD